RGPSDRNVRTRVIGHAMRNTPAGRDGEHVGIAVVFAREGNHVAVRRENRCALQAHAIRQTYGSAALSGDGPEVPGVSEGNGVPTESGRLEQVRLLGGMRG